MTRLLTTSVDERLRAIAGPAHVRAAGPADSIRAVAPALVVEPATEQEVAAILSLANDAGLAVVPRGGGTKLDWGNPPRRADVVLSLARLDRVIDHAWADLTVTVEAGCTIERLQETLTQNGQRLAVDALWPERATVGGILSTNDSGALRLRYGGLRDLIIGVTLALADGTRASSGGRVVKNVAGYDLQKLATGALGTLGVITRATFRLHPLPKNTRTLTVHAQTVDQAQTVLLAIQDSMLAHSALQVRVASDARPRADVLLEGTEAGIAAQEAGIRELAAGLNVIDSDAAIWGARETLWEPALGATSPTSAVAKLTLLPADLAATIEAIRRAAETQQVSWRAVVQATGIGYLRLDGEEKKLTSLLAELRRQVERSDGSLVVLHQPSTMTLDAWGDPGDALPLMRALKQQLDPRGTLNPGRFVGGI